MQLTRAGLSGTLSDDEARRLRQQFDREHCVRIRGLLPPDLLHTLTGWIDEVRFVERVHGSIGTEHCLPDGRAVRLLLFLANDPALLTAIDRLTGCGRIGCFTGRIYRMIPGTGDFDTWHSDACEDRLIGMSVNLGEPYEGGALQLRGRNATTILREVPNVGPGDAILFRIDDALQHRISPMAGAAPKTAFAGWFRRAPEFLTLIERFAGQPFGRPEG